MHIGPPTGTPVLTPPAPSQACAFACPMDRILKDSKRVPVGPDLWMCLVMRGHSRRRTPNLQELGKAVKSFRESQGSLYDGWGLFPPSLEL